MINITVGLAFLVPWLSLCAVWWLYLLDRLDVGEAILGTVLFFLATIAGTSLIQVFLERIGVRK